MPINKTIILLTGENGVGKDTFAQAICDYAEKVKASEDRDNLRSDSFRILSFATTLKDLATIYTDLDREFFETSLKDEQLNESQIPKWYYSHQYDTEYVTPRHLLKAIAMDTKDIYGNKFFAQSLIQKMDKLSTQYSQFFVMPDLRFNSEYDAIIEWANLMNLDCHSEHWNVVVVTVDNLPMDGYSKGVGFVKLEANTYTKHMVQLQQTEDSRDYNVHTPINGVIHNPKIENYDTQLLSINSNEVAKQLLKSLTSFEQDFPEGLPF